VLGALQRGLEVMYRIETALDVRDFLLDEAERDAFAPSRAPREQLLVAERDGHLELGLFLDAGVLRNLAARDPRDGLDEKNLADFVLTVEGVSHFIYVAWRAQARRQVSALELELQAEIDKYVTCLLLLLPRGGRAAAAELRPRLFDAFELEPGLDAAERERYLVANSNARAYAGRLEQRYVAREAVGEMLTELRWFYRLGVREKIAHIATAA
jgi:hypothetical protein